MTTHDILMAAHLPVVRAIVQAGDTETAYWRAGSGAPVIVLGAHDMRDETFSAQLIRLATHCRVIVPEVELPGTRLQRTGDDAPAFVEWVCSLAEGLGLVGAHVVATEAYGKELIYLAHQRADHFAAMSILQQSPREMSEGGARNETDRPVVPYSLPYDRWCDEVLRLQRSSPESEGTGTLR
jgi:hypothetical protein